MSQLEWGAVGDRLYETGIDRGVLYVKGHPPVPWDGLTGVAEDPDGGEATAYYYDGMMYANVLAREVFKATLNAFYSPKEFDECDGLVSDAYGFYATGQGRKPFGLSYRTAVGNDIDGTDYGYKIHIVYNASASIANRAHSTVNNSPNAGVLSWALTTQPVKIPGGRPTSHFIIDTTVTRPLIVSAIEDLLYGTDSTEPMLPTVEELIYIYEQFSTLIVAWLPLQIGERHLTEFSITGANDIVVMLDADTFQITADSVILGNDDTYTISSISKTTSRRGSV